MRAGAVDTICVATRIRGGWGEAFGIGRPHALGGAAAGTVVSVGSGVDSVWIGRRVVAGAGTSGSYAEPVVTGTDRSVLVPDGPDPRDAAALAHDGVTGTGISYTPPDRSTGRRRGARRTEADTGAVVGRRRRRRPHTGRMDGQGSGRLRGPDP
ncbi:alcohol dehydrogenase catalytic domain-containing protein [Embleya sp. NPDC055664]